MIEGVVVHHIADVMRPPLTHRTTWCCLNHPCDCRPVQLVRHSTHACRRSSGNTNFSALRPCATESSFAVSSHFRNSTAITHTISEPPTYTIVLSPLESNVPHQARLFSQSACFIGNRPSERCLNFVANSTPSSHVCMRQSLANAVIFYCTLLMITINTGPPSFYGDSVVNYSARSFPARQSATNSDTC